ncbi:putative conserved hypothetical protein [Colletotrichum sublineola]|uniref:Rhodopsin domain-containing protein n=1 Tax=Colletotrichum sublineola TaxID=1173701 RepID=A0A066X438_COLSU|nr:putative conserved hypothetical protein [Colletotrichum sublineola]
MGLQSSQPWLLTAMYLVSIIGGSVATVALVARLAVRKSWNTLEIDDYLMLPAWLCSVTGQWILIVVIRSDQPSQLGDVVELVVLLSRSLIEQSFVALCLRMFVSLWQNWAAKAMATVISIYTVVLSALFIYRTACPAAFPSVAMDGGFGDTLQLAIAATGARIPVDLVLVVVPVLIVARVQMKSMDKLRVILLWCLPVAYGQPWMADSDKRLTNSRPTAFSSARLYLLFCLPHSPDPTRSAAMAIVCLLVEVNLAIICGNLPAMLKATRQVKDRISTVVWAHVDPESGRDERSRYRWQGDVYALNGTISQNSSQHIMLSPPASAM